MLCSPGLEDEMSDMLLLEVRDSKAATPALTPAGVMTVRAHLWAIDAACQ